MIKISQYCSSIFLTILSCLLGILVTGLVNIGGVDSWISIILGTILGIFILTIYLSIYNFKSDLSFYEKIKVLFNKKSFIILNMFIFISILFSSILFWNLTNFISSQYLYNTPSYFIEIIFLITIGYFLSHKKTTIFRACLIFAYIFIVFYLFSFFGLINKIDLNNFKPMFQTNFLNIIKCTFIYISYTAIPMFFMNIISKKKIENFSNKSIIVTYIISNLVIFSVLFIVISIFGIDLARIYQYPTYHVLKRVFIERIENILSMGLIIVLLIPCSIMCYFSQDLIKNTYHFDCKIVLLIILYFSKYIFKNSTYGEYLILNILPFIMLSFIIVILIIFYKIKKIKR